jgi:hypothetical protein
MCVVVPFGLNRLLMPVDGQKAFLKR